VPDSQRTQAAAAPAENKPVQTTTLVWDRSVGFFSWSPVIAFALAYWRAKAEKHARHASLGYLLMSLVLVRLLPGVIGSPSARFNNFIQSRTGVLRHHKAIAAGHPRRFLATAADLEVQSPVCSCPDGEKRNNLSGPIGNHI
jgi:hypothetical protein